MIFSVKCPSWNMLALQVSGTGIIHQEGQKCKQMSPHERLFLFTLFPESRQKLVKAEIKVKRLRG